MFDRANALCAAMRSDGGTWHAELVHIECAGVCCDGHAESDITLPSSMCGCTCKSVAALSAYGTLPNRLRVYANITE